MREALILTLVIVGVPHVAVGQAAPLVVESITDLGRFADPPTAEILALGSMHLFGVGSAADAVVNPADLIRGPRGDVVVAMATGAVSRNLFIRTTANEMGIVSHEPASITGPWFPAGVIAAAVRRPSWAIGVFYDGSTRLKHRFSTDERTISTVSSPGGAVFQNLTGRTGSSVDVGVSRFGFSLALVAFGQRLRVGGSVEAIKVHVDAQSVSDLTSVSIIRPQPPTTTRFTETGELKADELKTGVSAGATWHPVPALAIAVVRRWVPAFDATLTSTRRGFSSGVEDRFSQQLTVDVPDFFSIGATFATAATKVGVEFVQVDYETLRYRTLLSPGGSLLNAAGVAQELRAGIQQRISISPSRALVVRGGVWGEGRHAVSTERPDRFLPETQRINGVLSNSGRRTWLTGGAAFEAKHATLAAAFGTTRDEQRMIITLGLRRP